MRLPIPTYTTPATDGRGWQHPGFGAGGFIPTSDLAVQAALVGIADCTGPGMDGADTEAAATVDTASVAAVALVSVVAIVVVGPIALAVDFAAGAATRALAVGSAAVAARVAVDMAADIAEDAAVMNGPASDSSRT